MEQKNYSLYSINVDNNNTEKSNDRVFDREQSQQANVERGQTPSKSNGNTRDVDNTVERLKKLYEKRCKISKDRLSRVRNIISKLDIEKY